LEKEKRKKIFEKLNENLEKSIGHFTFVYSVTWPLNANKAGVNFDLIDLSALNAD